MKLISNYIREGLRINKNTKISKEWNCIYTLDKLIDRCSKGKFSKDFINELTNLKENIINKKILKLLGSKAKWIGIYTEGETIEGITEDDVKWWKDDFEDDEIINNMYDIELGDAWDSDGGLHIYIRIRK